MNAWNQNRSMQYPMVGSVDMQSLMRQVYTWMVLGMLTTSVVAFVTVSSPVLINLALNPIILLIAAIAEIGLVIGIQPRLKPAFFRRSHAAIPRVCRAEWIYALHNIHLIQPWLCFPGICDDRCVVCSHVRHRVYHAGGFIEDGYVPDDGGHRAGHCDGCKHICRQWLARYDHQSGRCADFHCSNRL